MPVILKPLSPILREGLPGRRPVRDERRGILFLAGANGLESLEVPFESISVSDWGYVYERVVGNHFEDRGYIVQQRGIELQLLDQGVDIIAEKPGESDAFIQCKSGSRKPGKQSIESMLFQTGNFISKHRKYRKRCERPTDITGSLSALFARALRFGLEQSFGTNGATFVGFGWEPCKPA